MKKLGSVAVSGALLALTLLLYQTDSAHAYLDAGTGSILIQVVLGTVFGSILMIKIY
jgi:hypothetical protein